MKNLIAMLIITCLIFSCIQEKKSSKKTPRKSLENVLEFHLPDFNSGTTIGFKLDSTYYKKSYMVSCLGGGFKHTTEGQYIKSKNEITLIPKKITQKRLGKGEEEDQIQEQIIEPEDQKEQKNYYLSNIDDKLHLVKVRETATVVYKADSTAEETVMILSKDKDVTQKFLQVLDCPYELRDIILSYYKQNTNVVFTDSITRQYFSDFVYETDALVDGVREGVENKWYYKSIDD